MAQKSIKTRLTNHTKITFITEQKKSEMLSDFYLKRHSLVASLKQFSSKSETNRPSTAGYFKSHLRSGARSEGGGVLSIF